MFSASDLLNNGSSDCIIIQGIIMQVNTKWQPYY